MNYQMDWIYDLFGIEAGWFMAVQAHNIVAFFLKVLSALTFYVMVAVKVMISRRKMAKHRSSNAQSRFSHKHSPTSSRYRNLR